MARFISESSTIRICWSTCSFLSRAMPSFPFWSMNRSVITRFLWAFAIYIIWSARITASDEEDPATRVPPMLTERDSPGKPGTAASETLVCMRSRSCANSSSGQSWARRRNSSPPKRMSLSPLRSSALITSASFFRTLSPAL